ncbi:MAG TPA: P-loop NTPase [Terriglobales bacterium]|nr:P-loop NTPase [Terriglobales bacterium]
MSALMTAAVVSGDSSSSTQIQAWAQQSGLISTVQQWPVLGDKLPEIGLDVPGVIILDLPRDPETLLQFAGLVRRKSPNTRVLACISGSNQDSQLLLKAMRAGVQDILPKPLDVKALQEVLSRFAQELQVAEHKKIGKVIVVMGAKGGVGASTVAVNLGVQMRQLTKKRVGLLDFGFPLGVVQLMLDLKPSFSIRDAVENVDRLDDHFLAGLLTPHASQLQVLVGASHPEQWDCVNASALMRIVNVARASFDTLLIDYGAQFSGEWGPVLTNSEIMLVAEADVPSLWALERRLYALSSLGVRPEKTHVVINRWHRADVTTIKAVEKTIKQPVFACIPNDFGKISDAINAGAPLCGNHNNGLLLKYQEIAARLCGVRLQDPKRSSLSGLLPFRRS